MWCYADREGRFEWRPERIKIKVFPYDRIKIEPLLNQLIEHNFIIQYETDNPIYGFIPTFLDHQRPHPNEAASKLPEPSEELLNKINVIARTHQGDAKDTPFPSDSLNPDTRNPESLTLAFDRFWKIYPKKVGKDKALENWKRKKPSIEIVLIALKWQITSPKWLEDGGRFIPHPATYINQGRWKDEPEIPPPSQSTTPDKFFRAEQLEESDPEQTVTNLKKLRETIGEVGDKGME